LADIFLKHKEVRNELLQKHRESVKMNSRYKHVQLQPHRRTYFERNAEIVDLPEEGQEEEKIGAMNLNIVWRRVASVWRMHGYVDENFIIRPVTTNESKIIDGGKRKTARLEEPWIDSNGDGFFDCIDHTNIIAESDIEHTLNQPLDGQSSRYTHDCPQAKIDATQDSRKPDSLGGSDSDYSPVDTNRPKTFGFENVLDNADQLKIMSPQTIVTSSRTESLSAPEANIATPSPRETSEGTLLARKNTSKDIPGAPIQAPAGPSTDGGKVVIGHSDADWTNPAGSRAAETSPRGNHDLTQGDSRMRPEQHFNTESAHSLQMKEQVSGGNKRLEQKTFDVDHDSKKLELALAAPPSLSNLDYSLVKGRNKQIVPAKTHETNAKAPFSVSVASFQLTQPVDGPPNKTTSKSTDLRCFISGFNISSSDASHKVPASTSQEGCFVESTDAAAKNILDSSVTALDDESNACCSCDDRSRGSHSRPIMNPVVLPEKELSNEPIQSEALGESSSSLNDIGGPHIFKTSAEIEDVGALRSRAVATSIDILSICDPLFGGSTAAEITLDFSLVGKDNSTNGDKTQRRNQSTTALSLMQKATAAHYLLSAGEAGPMAPSGSISKGVSLENRQNELEASTRKQPFNITIPTGRHFGLTKKEKAPSDKNAFKDAALVRDPHATSSGGSSVARCAPFGHKHGASISSVDADHMSDAQSTHRPSFSSAPANTYNSIAVLESTETPLLHNETQYASLGMRNICDDMGEATWPLTQAMYQLVSSSKRSKSRKEDSKVPISPSRPKREPNDMLAAKWDECVDLWTEMTVEKAIDKCGLNEKDGRKHGPDPPETRQSPESSIRRTSDLFGAGDASEEAIKAVSEMDSRSTPNQRELQTQKLYVDTAIGPKPSPTRPPDWNTPHLIAGYLEARSSPKHKKVYSGLHQIYSTRSPKPILNQGSPHHDFDAPVLRMSERARVLKHRVQPSTPHRVISARSPFSPASQTSPGSPIRLKGGSPIVLRSPLRASSHPVLPKTAPRSRGPRSQLAYGTRSVGRPMNQHERHSIQICSNKFAFNLHHTMGPCDRCWSLSSPDEKAKFTARGAHLRIARTRGGCDQNCRVFPPENDEPALRLCRKCFFDTHQRDGSRLQVYRGNHVKMIPKY
jgi:hypothetical protein